MTCAIAVISTIAISPTAAHAASTSVVIPMTIRSANYTETEGLAFLAGETVLPQFGANVNHNFSESSREVHTARSWVLEAKPVLQACDTNVTFSVEGDHKFTHIANSAALTKSGDEPEVGGLVVDGGDVGLLTNETVATDGDMAIGKTLAVTVPSTAISVALANTGIKVVMYVETRDDRDQRGVQASFTYSGTPQLRVTYDHSGCVNPTSPTTTVKGKTPSKSTATTSPTTVATTPGDPSTTTENAYVLGKNISNGKQSGIDFGSNVTKTKAVIPHIKESSGNTLLNVLTFGTMVSLLGIGMAVFIMKQRKMRSAPGYRFGRK